MSVPNVRNLRVEPDLGQILDDIEAAIRKYCLLPSEHAYVAVTLWAATTHVINAFDHAPRLVARSAEKQSGKSRLVEVLAALVHDPLRTVNATGPYIVRSLGQEKPPTILLDEADTVFGTKWKAEQNEDLRGLLNAGHQRGLTFGRCEGPQHTPVQFATFAMAMLAGIGSMPDTIEDRAIVLTMRRWKPSERVAPFRQRRDTPPLLALRDRLAEWSTTAETDLDGSEPQIPAGVEDRAADTWEPLLAVAECAAGTWPKRAREACAYLVSEFVEDEQSKSVGVMLLADIREVFEVTATKFIKSATLCKELKQLGEAQWEDLDLDPSKLGRRLAEYGITTGHNESRSERGYRREHFLDAFERYLPADPLSESVQRRP